MSDSRTKNTTRNIFSGLIYRGVTILLPFINRTVILTVLGAEYTGLSSLFTSILGVLNLAELGFNTAVVYCMYKPMAEQNWNQICYYLTLIRKVYNIVGTVVFGSGLCKNKLAVKNGEMLSLGRHELTFLFAPMVQLICTLCISCTL